MGWFVHVSTSPLPSWRQISLLATAHIHPGSLQIFSILSFLLFSLYKGFKGALLLIIDPKRFSKISYTDKSRPLPVPLGFTLLKCLFNPHCEEYVCCAQNRIIFEVDICSDVTNCQLSTTKNLTLANS